MGFKFLPFFEEYLDPQTTHDKRVVAITHFSGTFEGSGTFFQGAWTAAGLLVFIPLLWIDEIHVAQAWLKGHI